MSGFVLNNLKYKSPLGDRGMIHYKNKAEIELMRANSLLVCDTLAIVAAAIKPGVTTLQLDKIAETFIKDNQASASFKGYHGFPYACCISVNDAVVHGFPTNRIGKRRCYFGRYRCL
jgi:methionyl aminopeptidase